MLTAKTTAPVRRRLQRWWREYRWSILLGLWLIAILLGYVGFSRQARLRGEDWSVLGTLYMTLQLFTLESGSDLGQGNVHPALEVARWMAPVVAAFTAAEALASLFYDRLQLWRARSLRGHVVLCGLGEKGMLLVRTFREMGLPVFVIEQDDQDDFREPARAHGAVVYTGDAREPETLDRARVQTARYLVAVCGDDGVNAEIAAVARALTTGQRRGSMGALTCVTHVVSPQLWHLLRRWELAGADESFRLQFFNVYDIGARALLSEHPPFPPVAESFPVPAPPPHLLVVGGGQMGQSVILHALREWRDRWWPSVPPVGGQGDSTDLTDHPSAGDLPRLRITLIDRKVERVREWLRLRHPGLERFCDLRECEMDTVSPEFHQAAFLGGSAVVAGSETLATGTALPAVTVAYVCLPDDMDSLAAALALHRRAHLMNLPVVACLSHSSGVGTLLYGPEADPISGAMSDTLFGFGLLEHACAPDLVLGGTTEILARAIHEHYLYHYGDVRDHGPATISSPSVASHSGRLSWNDLSEEWRESNRRQADHIRHKLQAIGCGIAPVLEWGDAAFPFTDGEVEEMAKLEHERWREERMQQGWTYGPQRDEARRTNPHLVSWEELPEGTRVFNRDLVRRIPDLLLRTGFQVYRLVPLPPSGSGMYDTPTVPAGGEETRVADRTP